MWTVPVFFITFAVLSYTVLPEYTVTEIGQYPVNSTTLSVVCTFLAIITFMFKCIQYKRGPLKNTANEEPLSTPSPDPIRGSPGVDTRRTMRGVVVRSYGDGEPVVDTETRRPEIRYVDEVLVRVHAASVNPVDSKICRGIGKDLIKSMGSMRGLTSTNPDGEDLPIILGRDFSGVVEKVGSKVTQFKVGDEVWAAIPFYQRGGLGDCITVTEASIARKPSGVTHAEAASFPYVATSVWCSLMLTAIIGSKRTKNQRVLIAGGTGGVGTFAIQLIKAWGGYVAASCRDDRGAKLIADLGADEVINISRTDLESALGDKPKFDVVIDTVGPSARKSCFKLCVKNGYYVSFVNPIMEDADKYGMMMGSFVSNITKMKLGFRNSCNFSWGFTLPDSKILDRVGKYIETKKIRPVIDKTYRVEEATKGFEHIATGPVRGKTVVLFH